MEKTTIVCDHCGRKPKAGLVVTHGQLTEHVDGMEPTKALDKTAILCATCRDRVYRFMERGFTAASKK